MRILQLAGYFFPEKAASIYLEENRYEAFSNAGFKTIVYAARPQRGLTEEEYKEYKNKKLEMMYNGGVEVHRFAMYREGKNAVLRAFRYFLISVVQLWKGIWAKDIDLIYVASTPPTQGALAALVKKCKKVPFVYNLQDIFPDSLAGTGLAKKGGLLWKIGRAIENFTYRNADKIIVISQDFKKNIMAKGVPEDKIVVVYNWVDQNSVKDIPRSENKLFAMYGLDPSKFYVTYNGNIGLTQNMDMLLEVAKALEANEGIHFVLVGNGAYLEQVKQIVADRNISNVHLLPFQPYEDISHVFSLGDVSLVISKPGVGENSVPSKTWSIMSASRPVLANFDENELKTIIEKNNCGIFTKAGDKVAFTDAILKLYNDRELCKEFGRNGRQFVMDNLTKEVGTQKYVDVIKSVASQLQR
ncbi:glycosyltransferase family 4 protein [Xylanibacter ruminicola]|uniref:Glycosyltransferase involved in cell wall bisynthesis n=1 Tax=Xylanibacter ruminicola TaxID=839 RepID=A0A1M6R6V3_XYLRU|nr:glycosyltransferase family 4 protein [Xylanibacter ruminicola]SHK28184.1 Glycosyltransferase involved in cell wall bisynthesis [Xylanibacter ruminicola]